VVVGRADGRPFLTGLPLRRIRTPASAVAAGDEAVDVDAGLAGGPARRGGGEVGATKVSCSIVRSASTYCCWSAACSPALADEAATTSAVTATVAPVSSGLTVGV
jgi:hypothetical protein